MKKIVLPLLLIACAGIQVAAQFSLGIHGGANFNRYRYSKENNVKEDPQGFFPGYYLGVTPAWKGSANKLEFSAPLQYAVRVYSVAEEMDIPFPSRERHHYVEINPRIGYALTKDAVVSLGAYWGYLLQTRLYSQGAWWEIDESIKKYLFKNLDFGATGAFTWHFNRLSFHGNAQFGIGSISGDGFQFVNGEPIVLNKSQLSFHIGMGYKLIGNP